MENKITTEPTMEQRDIDAANKIVNAIGIRVFMSNRQLAKDLLAPAFAAHRTAETALLAEAVEAKIAEIRPYIVLGDDDSCGLTDYQRGEKYALRWVLAKVKQP